MKYLTRSVVAVLVASLFVLYATPTLLSQSASPKFDTPDETINYFFATHLARTGSIAYEEPLNAQFSNPIIFMRWMQSRGVGSALLFPGTFLGFIIIAGVVAKIFGAWAILFVVPLSSVGAVAAMYWITRQIFDKRVALWSAIVLALLPPFVYYASRTMFHTVPFLFFVLVGIASYLQSRQGKYHWFFLVLAALGFGGALFIRFADIWWIGLAIAMLFLLAPLGWKKTAIFGAMMAGGIGGVLAMNHAIYGSALSFGYPIPGFSVSSATPQASSLIRFILPFGFHPSLVWQSFLKSLWQPYFGFIVLSFLGCAASFIRNFKTHRHGVIISTIFLAVISFYILSLYGSWSFSDSPTPGEVTIGSSYTRYFLPLLVLGVPCAAYLIGNAVSMVRSRSLRVVASVVLTGLLVGEAWSIAFVGKEGLSHVVSQTASYDQVVAELQSQGAKPEDIFLVHRGEDKILFPDFPRVINIDYLPEEMVRKNLENYSGVVWSGKDKVWRAHNPYKK